MFFIQIRVSSHADMNGQSGGDPLEEKYLNLYEQKLSPFQLVRLHACTCAIAVCSGNDQFVEVSSISGGKHLK